MQVEKGSHFLELFAHYEFSLSLTQLAKLAKLVSKESRTSNTSDIAYEKLRNRFKSNHKFLSRFNQHLYRLSWSQHSTSVHRRFLANPLFRRPTLAHDRARLPPIPNSSNPRIYRRGNKSNKSRIPMQAASEV